MIAPFLTELPVCADIKSAAECLSCAALKRMQAPLGNVQIIDWNKGYLEIIAQTGSGKNFFQGALIAPRTN